LPAGDDINRTGESNVRVVWLKEFGRPEVLVPGDAPDPVPGPGQVLIDVASALVGQS
jgi:NADPH:quinone reductase-like Zn-dependent oxidoreductase